MDALIVDSAGLARKLANKPKAFIIYELLQNAWDENVTTVTVTAEMQPGVPVCQITVEDDSPDGFQDMASVYTLFRDSKKGADPTKRGRFELGEKLVIASALSVQVTSTKGTVFINGKTREITKDRRPVGTLFKGTFRMTREEFKEMCQEVRSMLPPTNCVTTFNGEVLAHREPAHSFEATLQTVRVDADGNLATTSRKTQVHVIKPLPGEPAMIYEMGIPVVETGDQWHYDIQQRVPVNWERNSVPPSYLKTLRVEVLNALHSKLDKQEATKPWVTEALADARCEADAAETVLDQRFGEKRVIFDPSDPEGTKIAVSRGYTVIPGGALPTNAWATVRKFGTALPAGQVTPSPKPYSDSGRPERVISPSEWTPDQIRMAKFAQDLFRTLGLGTLEVRIVVEPTVGWAANFGHSNLCLNYGRLGKRWFSKKKSDVEVLDLLIHEFCHHTVSDHLSEEMHKTATKLGAQLANLALRDPSLFADV